MRLLVPSRVCVLLMLVASMSPGCSSRTLDSDGTDTSSGDESSSAPLTTGAPPTTGAPMTGPNVTTETPDPSTSTSTTSTTPGTATEPSDTTTSTTAGPTTADPSMPNSATGDPTPPKFDLPSTPAQVPEGIWQGCTKVAPPGTAIAGDSVLGPFTSKRAFFGYTDINGQIVGLRLMFLDDKADSDVAFEELGFDGQIVTGPAADVQPAQEFTVENPFWVGKDDNATLIVVANGTMDSLLTEIEITGHQGSWDVADPADPARLQGTIGPLGNEPTITGAFDAVFCDQLANHVFAE